jgi:hypothetical protein
MSKKHPRKYNLNLIRKIHVYSIAEVTELYGIHIGTVYKWLKKGLTGLGIENGHNLVFGIDLYDYINNIKQKKKSTMNYFQIYCVGCKQPISFMNIKIQLEFTHRCVGSDTYHAKIIGKCSCCGKKIQRFTSDRIVLELIRDNKIILIPSTSEVNDNILPMFNNPEIYTKRPFSFNAWFSN